VQVVLVERVVVQVVQVGKFEAIEDHQRVNRVVKEVA